MKSLVPLLSVLLSQTQVFAQVAAVPAPLAAAGQAIAVRWDAVLDGRASVNLRSLPPSEAPAIEKASNVAERDAFAESPACGVVDRAYFRQPSRAEGVQLLGRCLASVSQRYGVQVAASEGFVGGGAEQRQGIVLTVEKAGQAAEDLRVGLGLRGSVLFGYPAQVVTQAAAKRQR